MAEDPLEFIIPIRACAPAREKKIKYLETRRFEDQLTSDRAKITLFATLRDHNNHRSPCVSIQNPL